VVDAMQHLLEWELPFPQATGRWNDYCSEELRAISVGWQAQEACCGRGTSSSGDLMTWIPEGDSCTMASGSSRIRWGKTNLAQRHVLSSKSKDKL